MILKRLSLGNVQTRDGILEKCRSFKNQIPEHYFTTLLKDLSNKDLVALCGLITTKIWKPQKRLYVTPRGRAWVPQHERNKVFQLHVNQ
jgi:hypothetical protein